MDVRIFEDSASFAREAAGYLDADPFSSSVIAVQVDTVSGDVRDAGSQDRYWTVVEAGEPVGIAMHTPPHNLFLAKMPTAAAEALAQSLVATARRLTGVNGERGSVAAFAAKWTELTGRPSSPDVAMRMYRLEELTVPEGVEGRDRAAVEDDVELVTDWLEAFRDEAQRHAPRQDLRALAERRIRAGQFRLWDHEDEAVSLAGFSRPVAGVSRVGPVYTPPVRRRRGYGAAVTARASVAAIDAGAKHVVLYTDLANPTSNAIYQSIGYRPHHDAEERSFTRIVRVSREIAASSERIFELVADPHEQPRWDGNDNLKAAASGQRVRAAGDVFTMGLTMGSVRENHVVEFIEGRRIAWRPAEVGQPPPGHRWAWELEPLGPSRTLVTHTYDWTELADEERVPIAEATTADRLHASLSRLAALVEDD